MFVALVDTGLREGTTITGTLVSRHALLPNAQFAIVRSFDKEICGRNADHCTAGKAGSVDSSCFGLLVRPKTAAKLRP